MSEYECGSKKCRAMIFCNIIGFLILTGSIVGMVIWNYQLTYTSAFDDKSIGYYGKVYDVCDAINATNLRFNSYYDFVCGGYCSEYCDKQSNPDPRLFSKDAIKCVSIKVNFNGNNATDMIVKFPDCYDLANVNWNKLIVNKNGFDCLAWSMILLGGMVVFGICYLIIVLSIIMSDF